MTISAILAAFQGEVITVGPETIVSEVVALLAQHRIGAMPVVADGRVIGIVSERDVIYSLRDQGAATLDHPVARVMTAPAITVGQDISVLAALSQMTRKRIRHLPVVEADRLIGIVSIGDLVKYRIERIEQEAAAMRDYIQSA